MVEPANSAYEVGLCPNVLSYVLISTDGWPRRLVGSLYRADGSIVLSEEGASFSIPIGTEPKTLFAWLVDNDSATTSWTDVKQFRGVLLGGPLAITPGSLDGATTDAPSSTYDPYVSSALVYPGPVHLGGLTEVWQPATNPGFCDGGIVPVNPPASASISAGATTTRTLAADSSYSFDVDCSSTMLGILGIRWEPSTSAPGTIVVKAQRVIAPSFGGSRWVSSVANLEEQFTTVADTNYAHVELDMGHWQVTVSAIGVGIQNFAVILQRYQ